METLGNCYAKLSLQNAGNRAFLLSSVPYKHSLFQRIKQRNSRAGVLKYKDQLKPIKYNFFTKKPWTKSFKGVLLIKIINFNSNWLKLRIMLFNCTIIMTKKISQKNFDIHTGKNLIFHVHRKFFNGSWLPLPTTPLLHISISDIHLVYLTTHCNCSRKLTLILIRVVFIVTTCTSTSIMYESEHVKHRS